MPVLSWGHSQYWAGSAAAPEPPPSIGASGPGGYPTWQTSIILGSLLGMCQVWWERWRGSRERTQ